jgi:hypothetical protein
MVKVFLMSGTTSIYVASILRRSVPIKLCTLPSCNFNIIKKEIPSFGNPSVDLCFGLPFLLYVLFRPPLEALEGLV